MLSRKRPRNGHRNGPAGLRAAVLLAAFTALLAAGAQAQTTLPVGGAGHAGRIDAAGEVDRFEVPWVEHTHAYSGRYRVDVDVSAAGGLAVDDVGVRVFSHGDPDRLYRTEKVVDAPNALVSFLFYPAVNGWARLEVFSEGGNTGSYRVSVAKDATEPVDDQSEPAEPHWYQQLQIGHALRNRGAPRSIAAGAAATGEIEAPGDGDWFGVALTADMAYTTTLDVDGAGGTRIQLFGLFDANGGRLVEADKHGSGSGSGDGEYGDHLEFTPTVTGTYYLLVGSPAADTGGYTLAVSAGIPVSDDYAISGEGAGWVAVGGESEGEIERSHDADGFGAFLQPGIEYRIDLVNGDPLGTGGLADPVIRNIAHPQGWRIRRNGALLADDNSGSGANARLDFTPDLRGTYTIRVGGASGGTGTYILSLMQLDDYAAGVHTTGVAPVPGRVSGRVERAGDRDWFRMDFPRRGEYRIHVRGSPTSDGTLDDPKLFGVYASSGEVVPRNANDNGGTGKNARKVFEVHARGTFYLEVGASGSGTGTYAWTRRACCLCESERQWATVAGAVSRSLPTGGRPARLARVLTAGEPEFTEDSIPNDREVGHLWEGHALAA